uniref:IS200/IS605 family transposase n=1 Tax=Methanolobus halotolerans TaxID=2052935 RepID=UPI001F44F699|nr:IS200/IS605 family transposase [Methanolobus halotolerans]
MPEHIHLFISAQPFIAPNDIVNIIKGVTAKRAFQKFPELRKKRILGNHLWSASYYVGTHVKYLLKRLRNTLTVVLTGNVIHPPVPFHRNGTPIKSSI